MSWLDEEEDEVTTAATPEPATAEEGATAGVRGRPRLRTAPTPAELESPYADAFITPTDPQEVAQRLVPVRIYLSSPSADQIREVQEALRRLLGSLRLETYTEFEAETGSWLKRIIAATRDVCTYEELWEPLRKAERALELQALEKPQAQADQPRLEGAAELLKAIGDNDALVQIGSVLIVRHHSHNGPARIIVRTLSQEELALVQQNQQWLESPAAIFEILNTAAQIATAKRLETTTP
jgi:hypothetical protein